MRNHWLLAVAVGLAGAVAARAEVVITYATPAATAPMPVGPPMCGTAGCDAGCSAACKPSLRERLRALGARGRSCDAGCAQPCAPAAPAACAPARSCGASRDKPVWERIKAWLCYRPTEGCCDRLARGCYEAPLYTYFIDDCAQGPGCSQAPACCEKPGLWKRLCGSGHKMFGNPAGHGCGAGVGCANGACGVR